MGSSVISAFDFKKFRKKTGLKQSEFALRVGFSLGTIKSYESGRRDLSFEKFKIMRERLGYGEADGERVDYMIDYVRITFKTVRDLCFLTNIHLLRKGF